MSAQKTASTFHQKAPENDGFCMQIMYGPPVVHELSHWSSKNLEFLVQITYLETVEKNLALRGLLHIFSNLHCQTGENALIHQQDCKYRFEQEELY